MKGLYIPEFCGDKIVQATEQCDDGNFTSGDGCSASCSIEQNRIAVGYYYSCAIVEGGRVKCWGHNGPLKLGFSTTSSIPIDVEGITGGAKAISAGPIHTCILTDAGGVKCWGSNDSGRLGDGTTTDSSTPVDVSGLTNGVVKISAGYYGTCAITDSGDAKCWGPNGHGQLGDGTTTDRYVPVSVVGLSGNVTEISPGDNHTCALTKNSGIKCWGDNEYGQLGDGTTTSSISPVNVSGLTSGVIAVTAGFGSTCALTDGGGVKCWGNNERGQLGDGTTTDSSTPVDVSGLTSGVIAIEVGFWYTCAITTSGGVKCWGVNWYGQLGDGTTTDSYVPVDVSRLSSGVVEIATQNNHTCAVTTNGIKCWGRNEFGQLGNGTTTDRYVPVDVVGL